MTESIYTEPTPINQEDTEREKYILAELLATLPPRDYSSETPEQRLARKVRRDALNLTPEEEVAFGRTIDEISGTYGRDLDEVISNLTTV